MWLTRFLRTYGDWALALGLAVFLQIEVWTIDPSHPPGDVGSDVYSSAERAFAAGVGLVLTLSLAWRRRTPLVVLALAIAMSIGANAVAVLEAATTPAVALAIVAYSVGAHTEGRRASIGALGVAALIAANAAQNAFGDLLLIAMILGGAWASCSRPRWA